MEEIEFINQRLNGAIFKKSNVCDKIRHFQLELDQLHNEKNQLSATISRLRFELNKRVEEK